MADFVLLASSAAMSFQVQQELIGVHGDRALCNSRLLLLDGQVAGFFRGDDLPGQAQLLDLVFEGELVATAHDLNDDEIEQQEGQGDHADLQMLRPTYALAKRRNVVIDLEHGPNRITS